MKPHVPADTIRTIAVVVPAHNEEALIGESLRALRHAASHPCVKSLDVQVLVVLDACTDGTASVCREHDIRTIATDVRNVGRARALGFSHITEGLLVPGALTARNVWLATTDADTRVAADWLEVQLAAANAGADAVFGVVDIDDWSEQPPGCANAFERRYRGTDPERRSPHTHVHGANMGLRLEAYLRAGGMPKLSVGEDQALSDRLDDLPHLEVVRTTALRATTSARRTSRVQGGFADLLRRLTTAPLPSAAIPAMPR